MRADPLRHDQAFFRCDGFQVAFGQLFVRGRVVAQVFLVADEDDRYVRTEVVNLLRPLLDDVLQAVRVVDGEAHDDHVNVRVRQRSVTIKVLGQDQHCHDSRLRFCKISP